MRLEHIFITGTMVLLGAMSSPAQDQVSLTVDATMDIYRAGGYNDGSNGIAPVVFTFPAGGWRTMTFPSVGGEWGCQSGLQENGADGTTSGSCLVDGGPTDRRISTPSARFPAFILRIFRARWWVCSWRIPCPPLRPLLCDFM